MPSGKPGCSQIGRRPQLRFRKSGSHSMSFSCSSLFSSVPVLNWRPFRYWHFLTEPSNRIEDPKQRQKARLLAILVLCLFIFFSAVNLFYYFNVPGYGLPWPDRICFGLMVLAYGLSRSAYSEAGAVFMLLMFPLNVFASIMAQTTPNPSGCLSFLLPGYVLGSLFLDAAGMAAMGLMSSLLIALLPELAPRAAPELGSILGPLAASIVTVGVLVGVVRCRSAIEKHNQQQLAVAYDKALEGWSQLLEMRDIETRGHSHRVATLTLELARSMGVPEEELPHVYRGALLHDIGKLGIPDSVLMKAGRLTPEERKLMERHPAIAAKMLASIQFLQPALEIPMYHHEWWNGQGYPSGLKKQQIPLAARVFAVVDVWDAVLSDRPYRAGWTHEKAVDYIRSQSGKQFDPEVVDLFLRLQAPDRPQLCFLPEEPYRTKPRFTAEQVRVFQMEYPAKGQTPDDERIPLVRHY